MNVCGSDKKKKIDIICIWDTGKYISLYNLNLIRNLFLTPQEDKSQLDCTSIVSHFSLCHMLCFQGNIDVIIERNVTAAQTQL